MRDKIAIRLPLFGLGFLSIGSQIYLIRELFNLFYGNELLVGCVLSEWMLLTGCGAYLSRYFNNTYSHKGFLLILLLTLSVLPAIMLVSMDMVKAWFFPYGSIVGLWKMNLMSILLLFPLCLINGLLFPLLSRLFSPSQRITAYSIESIGSMCAGALVNLVFLWVFSTWQGLTVIMAVTLITVLFFAFFYHNRLQFILALFFSTISIGIFVLFGYQDFSDKLRFPDQQILFNRSTPYGQVVITENENQLNIYENGILLCSSGNEMQNEQSVHFAMIQHPSPVNILQVSGGFSGSTQEILKYHPARIDYVEMNPSLIKIASLFSEAIKDPRIHTHSMDVRRFIRQVPIQYNVVLIDLPEPSTLQVNRLYSDEFFSELKKKLNPGAVLSLPLPATGEYVSEHAERLNASLFYTLRKSFRHVMIVTVDRNYFLCSDSLLRIDIPALIVQKGIPTVFVNPYYMDSRQIRERSDKLQAGLPQDVSINHDFHPVTMVYHLLWSLQIFSAKPMPLMVIILVIVFLVLISLNPINAGLFTGGFTLASLEMILILALQVFLGYIYQWVGMIIMITMLGLSTGAIISLKITRVHLLKTYLFLQVILAVFSLVLTFFLLWLNHLSLAEGMLQLFLFLSAFLVSLMVGAEYGLALRLSGPSPVDAVAKNYAADLFGAALGAFLTCVFLFPLFGLIPTGFILFSLNLISLVLLYFHRKKLG